MQQPSNPFQSVTGLGPLKTIHRFNNFFRNGRLIFSGMLIASIFSCMCLMMYGFLQDAKNDITSTEGLGFTLGVAALMIFLALLIIFLMIQDWLKNRNCSAALFEGGIAIHDQKGIVHSVAWKEIDCMQAIKLRRTGFRNYKIITRDGRELVLNHFLIGVNNLAESVKQGITAHG
jgi:hypothetical protein